jgi:hypothetical protein
MSKRQAHARRRQVSSVKRMSNLLSNASRRMSNFLSTCQHVNMSNVKISNSNSETPGRCLSADPRPILARLRESLGQNPGKPIILSLYHSIKSVFPRVCETCLPLTPAMKVKMQVNSAVTRRCMAKEIGYRLVVGGIKLHFHLVHSRLEHVELLLLHNGETETPLSVGKI